MKWQPIKTAPRNSVDVLLSINGVGKGRKIVTIGYMTTGVWICRGGFGVIQEHVTHWMPVPAPPEDEL